MSPFAPPRRLKCGVPPPPPPWEKSTAKANVASFPDTQLKTAIYSFLGI